MYSLYSEYHPDRERAKDEYEIAGAKARAAGKERWDNPHASDQEKADMKEFAPWIPVWGSGRDENLPAYYWDCGFENWEEWV